MKYKFQVLVDLIYSDKKIYVAVDLTDKEVDKIKNLVAKDSKKRAQVKDETDEDSYVPTQDLLQILDDHAPKLFNKFWDIIFPKVFVEELIYGFESGSIEEKHPDDNYLDYHKVKFGKLYAMYGDWMELEHSSCCICRIPEELESL